MLAALVFGLVSGKEKNKAMTRRIFGKWGIFAICHGLTGTNDEMK
jgi:hypothetical protein